jgi:hypothetical protein
VSGLPQNVFGSVETISLDQNEVGIECGDGEDANACRGEWVQDCRENSCHLKRKWALQLQAGPAYLGVDSNRN